MTKDELFKLKGQLTWDIEVSQAHLKKVNEDLVKIFNSKPPILTPVPTEIQPVQEQPSNS